MAIWPSEPVWHDLTDVNLGQQYEGVDGVTVEDMNKIIENILYLKKYGPTIPGGVTVTFFVGEEMYAAFAILGGKAIAEPEAPSYTSQSFRGWYTAPVGGERVTFPYTPSGNKALYAQTI